MRYSRRLLTAVPAVTALITLLFGLLVLGLQRWNASIAALEARAHHGYEIALRAHGALRDVENNQRGYVVTGTASFLSAYDSARTAVGMELAALRQMVRSEAAGQLVAGLDSLAAARIALADEVIRTRREAGLEEAAALMRRGQGPAIMSSYGARMRDLSARLESSRAARQRAHQRLGMWFQWIVGIGTVIAAGAALGSGYLLLHYARSVEHTSAGLEQANLRLREQTFALSEQAAELEIQAQELEETSEELRDSGSRFRALVQNSTDVTFVIDAADRFSFVSASSERVLGCSPEKVRGQGVLEALHPDDMELARSSLRAVRTSDGLIDVPAIRYRHSSGAWRVMSARLRNLTADAAVHGIIVNCHDITEIEAAHAQLRQAQKMEAVGRLAGGIAHDFNNLLTSIVGYARLAAAELSDDGEAREDLEQVIRAGELATALTRQLLAFSRQQVLRPVVVEINDVVHDSVRLMERLIGENAELRTQLAPDAGNVRVDRAQLHQVIMNLVLNARDTLQGSGVITIETASTDQAEENVAEEASLIVPGHFVCLSVSDTGMGMSPELRERIFEPFFTTKQAGEGTGLGLSTTLGIVKQSGGYVRVDSTEGQGTTFRIFLPQVKAEAAAALPATASRPSPAGTTVLIVEDEPAVRGFARKVLTRAGYSVLEAANGAEALAVLEEQGGAVQLVMTDVVMPGMSGSALAEEIHREYPGMRVLFTSGYPEGQITVSGDLREDVAFIEKPYSPAQLVECVGGLCA